MTDKATIRVFIADDHAIVREGLKQILAEQRDIVVAGEAENGLDAIKLFRKSRCHVMLLDISMPDRNGIEVLKQIKQERPELAVLMLSMHREDQYAIRALKAGAAGYLTKQSAPRELVTAIRQVAGGQKYVSATLAQALASQVGADLARRRTTACRTANSRR
jgi:two-component system invasion response regulator UvrY